MQLNNKPIYLCSPKKFEGTQALPMIQFKRVLDALDLESFDTLLFTSKQAIFYTNEVNSNWRKKRILAVGAKTAQIAKELGAQNIYHPKEFYGSHLAKDILKKFADAKILYIRPKVVSFDSKTFLAKEGINIDEAILYETNCLYYENRVLEDNAVIIFTSPSTIECFFKSFEWKNGYKAVVIGKSTLTKLPKIVTNVKVAKVATIASCIETAQNY